MERMGDNERGRRRDNENMERVFCPERVKKYKIQEELHTVTFQYLDLPLFDIAGDCHY